MDTARLAEQQLDFALGIGLVLHFLRDDEHFSWSNTHTSVAKINLLHTVKNNESLIGVFVLVAHQLALKLYQFELIVVHLRDDLGLPRVSNQAQIFVQN